MKRIPVLEKFSWQPPIIAVANSGTATKGFRYIVGNSPSGNFSGFSTDDIAWYDGYEWHNDIPLEGWKVYNLNDSSYYSFIMGASEMQWVKDSSSGSGSSGGSGLMIVDNFLDIWDLTAAEGDQVHCLSNNKNYVYTGTQWIDQIKGYPILLNAYDRNLVFKFKAQYLSNPLFIEDESQSGAHGRLSSSNNLHYYARIIRNYATGFTSLNTTLNTGIGIVSNLPDAILAPEDNVFIFVVGSFYSTTTYRQILYSKQQEVDSTRIIPALCQSTAKISLYDQIFGTWYNGSTSMTANTMYLWSWKLIDGETSKGFINGTLDLTGGVYDATRSWNILSMFGAHNSTSSFLGDIYEIRIYKNISDADFSNINTEIKTIYGL